MTKSSPDSPGTQQSAHVSLTWGNQPLFTLKQAAQYAICTPRYLQNQIRSGRLKALKLRASWLGSGDPNWKNSWNPVQRLEASNERAATSDRPRVILTARHLRHQNARYG
jgi:hypothetical protein